MSIHFNRIRFLLLLATVLLTACGFHLRGSGSTGALPFKTLAIINGESPLGIEIKRYAVNSGTAIVTDIKTAQAVLDLTSEVREKVILSLNSQGRVREYQLNYRVVFRVKDNKDFELLAPTEINVRRILSFNEAQVLAKESEEAALYREMQSDMVQQVLRRVGALKPADGMSSPGLTSAGTTTAK
jgi:LPS-assembly lipoprotein